MLEILHLLGLMFDLPCARIVSSGFKFNSIHTSSAILMNMSPMTLRLSSGFVIMLRVLVVRLGDLGSFLLTGMEVVPL